MLRRHSYPVSRFIARLWIVLAWLTGGLLCILVGLAVAFKLWAPRVVEEYQASIADTPSNILVYAAGGELLANVPGVEDRLWVPLYRIHPFVQKAVVAIEDRRFFAHRGMDPVRLGGAVWADLRSWSLDQGGSTLTQQLVKLSLLSSEHTLRRKAKELFMALALEQEVPKLQLLESYLNKVYFGYGMYGVEKAARGYFGKSADTLSLNEAAFLAALIKKPEGFLQISGRDPEPDSAELPLQRMEPLLKRQKAVVEAMFKLGWIGADDLAESRKARLRVLRPRSELGAAPYFVQQVLKELKEILSVSHITGRGYRVVTTLDLKQQRAAEAQVARLAREHSEAGQAALVALDPRTGEVRALVGGVDFSRSQFNRATQAQRQPGSAFKPILYAAAFEQGFSPLSVFHDEPVRFVWSGGRHDFKRTLAPGSAAAVPPSAAAAAGTDEKDQAYEPHNFDGHYGLPAARTPGDEAPDRRMTLGRALELSSNVIAVQLLDQLGMNPLVSLASRYNLTIKPEMGLCVALGCSEVTLLSLTAAYGSFANGGLRVQPVFIRSVTNGAGEPLYVHTPALPEQVIGEWTAFEVRQMLTGVIERGTGQRARIGRPAAGKTGTNDGPRDTWFIGFTPDLAAGVWIGNDDNRPLASEAGGRTTARMWADFMRQALPAERVREFPEPSVEVVGYRICNQTGRIAQPGCPDSETYYFPRNEVPADIFVAAGTEGGPDSASPAAPAPTSPGAASRNPAAPPGAGVATSAPVLPGTARAEGLPRVGATAAPAGQTAPAGQIGPPGPTAPPGPTGPPGPSAQASPAAQAAPVVPGSPQTAASPAPPPAAPLPFSQLLRDTFSAGPAPRAVPPR